MIIITHHLGLNGSLIHIIDRLVHVRVPQEKFHEKTRFHEGRRIVIIMIILSENGMFGK